MLAWASPELPDIPTVTTSLAIYDTSTGAIKEPRYPTSADHPSGLATMYVCGITPYDATHLGHANTYVHFDQLLRFWRASGYDVRYTQNVTDIDDPLLERAEATGVEWEDLAAEQVELFRADMSALRVIAPNDFPGAVENIPGVRHLVAELLAAGLAYPVQQDDDADKASESMDPDIYFDIAAAAQKSPWTLGEISGCDRDTMMDLFPQRGGDPKRPGKRDPLDPLLWRARRAGEPWWDGGDLPAGRPGWHIECAVMARRFLPAPFTVQGGGSDLRFPHHEFSAAHAIAHDSLPLAETFVHAGMVGLEGEKMSKSRGNLVLVSGLRQRGIDPQVIRALLLDHHYQQDWSYTEDALTAASERLNRWKQAYSAAPKIGRETAGQPEELQLAIEQALAANLNAPAALKVLDTWAQGELGTETSGQRVRAVVDALLGIELEN